MMQSSNRSLLNSLFWFLAVLVLVAGVLPRFRIPQVPLMDKDSVGYLAPALSKYAGGLFQGEHARSYPYPAMVYLALVCFRNFKAVAVLQHISGILAGFLMILSWNRSRALIRPPGLPQFVFNLIGLFPALVFLVSSKNILYEHKIRPEAVMPFFVILGVLLTVEFIRSQWIENRPRAAFVYGTAVIFNSALMYFLKPSWGVNVGIGALPVMISFLTVKEPIGWKLSRMAVPVVLVLGVLWWPDNQLKKSDPMGSLFFPETLFTIHANIILEQMSKDLQHNDTPYPTELLAKTEATLRKELQPGKASRNMATMEFDPDYLLYRSPILKELTNDLGENQKVAAFCVYYYKRAFLKNPGAMFRKFRTSMSVFYQKECPVYETEKKASSLAKPYDDTAKLIASRSTGDQTAARNDYLAECQNLAHSKPSMKPAWLGRGIYKALRLTYLPSLVAAVLLCLGIFLARSLRNRLWIFGAYMLLMFSYNFGTCFTVSVVHTLGIRRYVHSQQLFAVYAQFLPLLVLAEIAVALWGCRGGCASRLSPRDREAQTEVRPEADAM